MNPLDPPVITIDPQTCKRDGLCARLCPVGVFTAPAGQVPAVAHTEECVLCGQCLAGCPQNAIQHSGFEPASVESVNPQVPLTPQTAYALLSQRRSVRNYKKEVPTHELLETVIAAASCAPGSPHHRIGWERRFIVVSGQEKMQKVCAITAEYVQQTYDLINSFVVRLAARFDDSARSALAVAPDLAMRLEAYRAGQDKLTYNAPAAVFAIAPLVSSTPQVDCDAALYAVLLMAQAYGLGSCWNGLLQGAACGDHLRGFTRLSEFLSIPAGYKCYAAATFGYPQIHVQRVVKRAVDIQWV